MLDKRSTLFPSREHYCFLSHCAISPLYVGAASAANGFQNGMVAGGITALADFSNLLPRFRNGFGSLMKTTAGNISFVHTTAEAMCQIANGYPFEPGDQIISYIHEYPSNHYPWLMQKRRGVELLLLPDTSPLPGYERARRPGGWSMEDLEELCGSRTRIIALSHVQFASGYAADLAELGSFCQERGIDLIIDCAQSLGCLPVYPEEYGVSAVAASGWKWLMGPKGAAVLFTTSGLREKLTPTMAGPGMMKQQFDYLNHSWDPYPDSRLFEYSTLPLDHIAAFAVIVEDLFTRYSAEEIRNEVFRLQDLFLEHLDPELFTPQVFDRKYRSGIVSISAKADINEMVDNLGKERVVVTQRGGYLRLAPHFYLEDAQLIEAAHVFNKLGNG